MKNLNWKIEKLVKNIRNSELELSDDKRKRIDKVAEKVFHQYREDLRRLEG